MENVVLVVHLILALSLIGVVLMQRSEGGMGGLGGGGSGAAGSRPATTVMAKFTWLLAAAFIATSITLTIIAAQNSAGASVIDRLGDVPLTDESGAAVPDLGESLLPPSSDDAPLVPSGD